MVISRSNLSSHLEGEIVSGRLQPGTKLPSERQLSEQSGLSRPVIREVVRTLSERGLVEVFPGRGAFVRTVQATDASDRLDSILRRRQPTPRHLVAAREMLECTAVRMAASHASPEDIARIENATAGFDRAADLVARVHYDWLFHAAIAQATDNPVIETMFNSIATMTVELMLRSVGDPGVVSEAIPLHRAIAEAIVAGDGDRAEQSMRTHLNVAASHYGDDFDRSVESVARREISRLVNPDVSLEDLLSAATDGPIGPAHRIERIARNHDWATVVGAAENGS